MMSENDDDGKKIDFSKVAESIGTETVEIDETVSADETASGDRSRGGRRRHRNYRRRISIDEIQSELEELKGRIKDFVPDDYVPVSQRFSPKVSGIQSRVEEFKSNLRRTVYRGDERDFDIQLTFLDYFSPKGERREQLRLSDVEVDEGAVSVRDKRYLFGVFLDRYGAHQDVRIEQALNDLRADVRELIKEAYYREKPSLDELREVNKEIVDRCEIKGEMYCTPMKQIVDDTFAVNRMRKMFIDTRLDERREDVDEFCEAEPDLCRRLRMFGDDDYYHLRDIALEELVNELRELGY